MAIKETKDVGRVQIPYGDDTPVSIFQGTLERHQGPTGGSNGVFLVTADGTFEVTGITEEAKQALDQIQWPNDKFMGNVKGHKVQGYEGYVIQATDIQLQGQPLTINQNNGVPAASQTNAKRFEDVVWLSFADYPTSGAVPRDAAKEGNIIQVPVQGAGTRSYRICGGQLVPLKVE